MLQPALPPSQLVPAPAALAGIVPASIAAALLLRFASPASARLATRRARGARVGLLRGGQAACVGIGATSCAVAMEAFGFPGSEAALLAAGALLSTGLSAVALTVVAEAPLSTLFTAPAKAVGLAAAGLLTASAAAVAALGRAAAALGSGASDGGSAAARPGAIGFLVGSTLVGLAVAIRLQVSRPLLHSGHAAVLVLGGALAIAGAALVALAEGGALK